MLKFLILVLINLAYLNSTEVQEIVYPQVYQYPVQYPYYQQYYYYWPQNYENYHYAQVQPQPLYAYIVQQPVQAPTQIYQASQTPTAHQVHIEDKCNPYSYGYDFYYCNSLFKQEL